MKLTKSQLLQIIREELSETSGLGRAMGRAMGGLSSAEDVGAVSSLEEGVLALIRDWDPSTPEGQKYLQELQAVSDRFRSEEREYVTLRDPGRQLAFEIGPPPLPKIKDVAGTDQ